MAQTGARGSGPPSAHRSWQVPFHAVSVGKKVLAGQRESALLHVGSSDRDVGRTVGLGAGRLGALPGDARAAAAARCRSRGRRPSWPRRPAAHWALVGSHERPAQQGDGRRRTRRRCGKQDPKCCTRRCRLPVRRGSIRPPAAAKPYGPAGAARRGARGPADPVGLAVAAATVGVERRTRSQSSLQMAWRTPSLEDAGRSSGCSSRSRRRRGPRGRAWRARCRDCPFHHDRSSRRWSSSRCRCCSAGRRGRSRPRPRSRPHPGRSRSSPRATSQASPVSDALAGGANPGSAARSASSPGRSRCPPSNFLEPASSPCRCRLPARPAAHARILARR